MRVFIAFLLLASLYFPGASALENTAIASVKKTFKKAAFVDKSQTFKKKGRNSLSKEPFAENLGYIHQNSNQQNAAQVLDLAQQSISYQFTPISVLSFFKSTGNYSYQFIFNCLFPKHTFW